MEKLSVKCMCGCVDQFIFLKFDETDERDCNYLVECLNCKRKFEINTKLVD